MLANELRLGNRTTVLLRTRRAACLYNSRCAGAAISLPARQEERWSVF